MRIVVQPLKLSVHVQPADGGVVQELVVRQQVIAVNIGSATAGGGGSGGEYTHTQSAPAATWIINHNLGYKPAVAVVTVGGAELLAEVLHTSINQTVIYLASAYAGSARLT